MTIRELINRLEKFDSNLEVFPNIDTENLQQTFVIEDVVSNIPADDSVCLVLAIAPTVE